VLLYDLLRDDDDKIRLVRLSVRPGSHQGTAFECCPKPYQSVAIVEGSLRLVELEAFRDRLPGKDPETRGPKLRIDDWTLTTYTNCNVNDAPEDWKIDCTVRASNIIIDRTMRGPDCFVVECWVRLRRTVRLQSGTCRNSGHVSLFLA
jgi:hypothetical protein